MQKKKAGCQSTVEWINKIDIFVNGILYHNQNEQATNSATRRNLKNTMLRDRRPAHTKINCVLFM